MLYLGIWNLVGDLSYVLLKLLGGIGYVHG